MRQYDTSMPFHMPHREAMISGTTMTIHNGAQLYWGSLRNNPGSVRAMPVIVGLIMMQATDEAIAMTAPTERSTPPVAITSVMPMARITVGDPFRRMSMTLPKRWPSFSSSLKKPGMANRSNAKIISNAAIGRKSMLSVSLLQVRANETFMTHFLRSPA